MLYAIGIGLDVDAQLTLEARRAIRTCSIIFALTPDAEALTLLRRANPIAEIIDCSQFYEHRSKRPDVYDSISDAVIDATSPYTDVALVVYGHPMFLVSAVEKMLERAKVKKIETKVIPGISSFDTVLADLQLDLGYGVVVVDATALLSNRQLLETQLPLLVFQVANIGCDDVERGVIPVDRLRTLLRFLQKVYPPEHRCKLIVSRRSIYEDGYIVEDSISCLAENTAVQLGDRPTLYVPPLVEH